MDYKIEDGMKCYKHKNRQKVGECKHCGKFMCEECLEISKLGLCDRCAVKEKEKLKREVAIPTQAIYAISIGALVFLAIHYFSKDLMLSIIFGWIVAGLPYGSKKLKDMKKIENIQDNLVPKKHHDFFIFDFIQVIFIGIILLPISLIKTIIYIFTSKSKTELKKTINYIDEQLQKGENLTGVCCYYHRDRALYNSCKGCKKFLCKECFEKYGNGLCDECNNK